MRGSLRVGALVVGVIAGILMIVVGCTTVTEGTPEPDTAVAPAYRSAVSASLSDASVTSASKRQQSMTTRAVSTACAAFITTGVDVLEKVNAYIEARNSGGAGTGAERPAIDALNHSATEITRSLSDALPPELRDALNAYVDAVRTLVKDISSDAGASELNSAIGQFNDTKTTALRLCEHAR